MEITLDPENETRATRRLQALLGLGAAEAEALLSAAVEGAVDRTLERVGGSAPVPTSVVATRAEELRYCCLRANRILERREVEVLFRIAASGARAILTTTRATYEESLQEQFASRMREDARVEETGNVEDGQTYTIGFSEVANFETAKALLRRRNLHVYCESNQHGKTLALPREITIEGVAINPLEELGFDQPGQDA